MSEDLELRVDLFATIFLGTTSALSHGWDEVIVQFSEHHGGKVIEIIRTRLNIHRLKPSFVMIGMDINKTKYRNQLIKLREQYQKKVVD